MTKRSVNLKTSEQFGRKLITKRNNMKTCIQCHKDKKETDYYGYNKNPNRRCKSCVISNNQLPKLVVKNEMSYKDYLIKANMMEYHKKSLRFQV